MPSVRAALFPSPRILPKRLGGDEGQICLEGTEPAVIIVRADTSGQHTIHWSNNIVEIDADATAVRYSTTWLKHRHNSSRSGSLNVDTLQSEELQRTLPPGSCNLYTFPIIKTSMDPRGRQPTAAELRILHRIVVALYTQSGCLDQPDEVGAHPVYALAVSNVPESIALVVELHRQRPDLMAVTHVRHRSGEVPVFLA